MRNASTGKRSPITQGDALVSQQPPSQVRRGAERACPHPGPHLTPSLQAAGRGPSQRRALDALGRISRGERRSFWQRLADRLT